MISKTNVDYLRVSVTDRCNLRCMYCNPLDDKGLADHAEILSSDEVYRVVRLCTESGVTRVRLTGGEPLVRRDIVSLVRRLASISSIEDLSLTTNGVLLASMAAVLREAGLQRVNISLDAAEGGCFRQITGSDMLGPVMSGVYKALDVGLTPVRINCVVLREVNVCEVPALAEMSLRLPVSVRFIEYCPPGRAAGRASWYVSNDEVRDLIESRFGLLSPVVLANAGGPAVYFRVGNATGTIGFISGRSSVFCHRCRRLRLTCNGKLRPCLHCAKYYDIKRQLRSGADDAALLSLIRNALGEKGQYTKLDRTLENFSMQHMGG